MLTSHGISSSHTNEYGDGSLANHLVIASLPQSGKLARDVRYKISVRKSRRFADFVGLVVCSVKRVAIVLTDILTSTDKPNQNLCYTSSGTSSSVSSSV